MVALQKATQTPLLLTDISICQVGCLGLSSRHKPQCLRDWVQQWASLCVHAFGSVNRLGLRLLHEVQHQLGGSWVLGL